MLRAAVVSKVKALLEEYSPFTEPASLLAVPNNDVKPVNSYIEQTLDKAYDDVLMSAPLYMVGSSAVSPQTTPQLTINDGVGSFAMPNNFLRLHTIQMDCWKRPVNDAISSQSEEYKWQMNPYTRGKVVKPVVALNNGKIELYSVKDNSQFAILKYIPRTADNTASFDDSLADLLAHACAVRVLDIFEQTEKSAAVKNKFAEIITNVTI